MHLSAFGAVTSADFANSEFIGIGISFHLDKSFYSRNAVSKSIGSDQCAGNVGVARDFDLGRAARSEGGELGLGFEGCGDVEGLPRSGRIRYGTGI